MNATRRSFSLALLALPLSQAARALEPPVGKGLLTIKGRVSKPNVGKDAVFTMDMLARLPQRSFKVSLDFLPRGSATFSGPLLKDVLEAAGASGSKITTLAADNYSIEIPFSDAAQFNPILSILLDGKPMSQREFGPLWIMYPIGSRPELDDQKFRSRATFSVKQLTVD